MKYLATLVLFLLAIPAHAANVTCTLPNANVTRATELCEELRRELRIRSSEWNNNICASQFLRLGLLQIERKVAQKAAKQAVQDEVNTAIVNFESTWPLPTAAICGDGIFDSELPFSEKCDDGNRVNGDGCDSSCLTE